MNFKPKFIERYSRVTDWEAFKKVSLTFLRRSIRINTLKISIDECKKRLGEEWSLDQIPWCKEGFWIKNKKSKRRDIGNTKEHESGLIYVQEAASMIPPLVLNPNPYDKVLDMCASPGSKSTQIAALMRNRGLLVANDLKTKRINVLKLNLQRCGVVNDVVTMMDGHRFRDFNFDKVLVDAPCSGTGNIRRSLKTLQMWNPLMVKRLSKTQKSLLDTGFNALKKGGTLVYSTCSLEPEENEEVINHLIDKYDNARLEEIKLNIKRSKAITEFEGKVYSDEVKKCLRIWPQDNDTGGFFLALLRKI